MKPSVYVFTLDCLRAATTNDESTPFLNSRPIQMSRCYSSGTWTLPAHASLFSGKHPIDHGVTRPGNSLKKSDAILPRAAKKAGYETAIFSENPTFSSQTGFGHYIDETHDDIHQKLIQSDFSPFGQVSNVDLNEALSLFNDILHRPNRSHNIINTAYAVGLQFSNKTQTYPHHGKRLFSHLSSYNSKSRNPRLVVTNVLDPHNPYHGKPPSITGSRNSQEMEALRTGDDNRNYLLTNEAPPSSIQSVYGGWSEFFDVQEQVYEEYAQECDHLLANYCKESSQIYDDSLIVILGDHGQLFGAEGMVGHHISLHPHGIHVPLCIDPPRSWNRNTKAIDTPVSTAGVGLALSDVLSGKIDTTPGLIRAIETHSREEDNSVISCVDGPTWTMSQLYDDNRYKRSLIDDLAVRKVARIYDRHVDIFKSGWKSNEVEQMSYTYTVDGREEIEQQKESLNDDQIIRWVKGQYNHENEERDSVNQQLKALGYV